LTDLHKFWLLVRIVDIINCAKFYRNRLRGLDSDHSHRNVMSPLTLLELTFSCDKRCQPYAPVGVVDFAAAQRICESKLLTINADSWQRRHCSPARIYSSAL